MQVFANTIKAVFLHGSSYLQNLEQLTSITGRMKIRREWILEGAIIGVQGGTLKVRKVYESLRKAGVPVAAMWLQDWVGQRTTTFGKQLWWNWELDENHYPGFETLLADLKKDRVRIMGYVNPFLTETRSKKGTRRNLYGEASQSGYLIKDSEGANYLIENTSFSAGLVDITNEKAVQWLQQIIEKEMLNRGFSGYMADFGEALPFDSVLYAVKDASNYHNKYPEEWAKLNYDLINRPEHKDKVFFMRSGYSRSPRYSSLFWLGDQMVTWDNYDGLKSAITGLLSGGLSGFTLNHSDIGGYTTIKSPLKNYFRSNELLIRWAQHSAFTVVFRTHEGNMPSKNAQVYDDEKSLSHFARSAKLYRSWAFYRKELVKEASLKGWPVARSMMLHYPDANQVYHLNNSQYMLGTDIIVAPVVDEGSRTKQVFLPGGDWVEIMKQRVYSNVNGMITVQADIDYIPFFVRKNTETEKKLRENLEREGLL